jgi:hypothetical protein
MAFLSKVRRRQFSNIPFRLTFKGIIWKRLRWPWIALRGTPSKSDINTINHSKRLRNAESYLKDLFPEALVARSILQENLRESNANVDDTFNLAQGELLGLGITRYARVGGNGRYVGGLWKRICIAFPSGELRTNISMSLHGMRTDDRSGLGSVVHKFGGFRLSTTSSLFDGKIER